LFYSKLELLVLWSYAMLFGHFCKKSVMKNKRKSYYFAFYFLQLKQRSNYVLKKKKERSWIPVCFLCNIY